MQGPIKALCLLALAALCLPNAAANPGLGRSLLQANPNFTTPDTIPVYVAAGDVTAESAVLWARCPEAGNVSFAVSSGKVYDSVAGADSDFTAKVLLTDLVAGNPYYYEVTCEAGGKAFNSTSGKFTTAPMPTDAAEVSFAWVADIAGQGWGINKDSSVKLAAEEPFNGDVLQGGYFFAETVARLDPSFVIWAGDTIYADGPIPATKELNITKNKGAELVEQLKWKNTYVKDFQAITLQEFRQNWLYNLFDTYYANLLASTASWFEWDDHEVSNNWWPGENNTRPGLDAESILPSARQSFYEYTPITPNSPIYRSHQHGQHLEVFNVDLRSYRGRNIDNTQESLVQMFGAEQYKWLLTSLKASNATWKVIVNDVPIGMNVGDGPGSWESFSNNDTRTLGREFQTRALLAFIKQEAIKNVIFITADVHMTAAVEYAPERATGGFKDFDPFYEVVIGPCHAGSFDNPTFDNTFGPQALYIRTPTTEGYDQQNLPPPYTSSFGYGSVSKAGDLTLQVRDITGTALWSKVFTPAK